jgi:hypothetical protein
MSRRRYSVAAVDRAGPEFFARRAGVPRAARRLAGYLRAVFAEGLASWDFDFGRVARGLAVSRRSVERALAWLRENDRTFNFLKRRVGRVWGVRVSLRQKAAPLPRTPSPRCSDGESGNTAKARILATSGKLSVAGARRLAGFAGYVARRDLAGLHYDNCKVHFRFAHAFNFALAALRRGFARKAIVRAYEAALLRRHRDATDCGLSQGGVVKFEPSSTVSLARTLLADGREDAERVADRLELLAPVKAENARFAERCRAELRAAMQRQSAA